MGEQAERKGRPERAQGQDTRRYGVMQGRGEGRNRVVGERVHGGSRYLHAGEV